ncbi:MAG: HNH endonuclease [Candidatus Eremiobacteraeota bacterium]|nr:HNH endonuclease [Candidatus Eremiobacteraeota bacterium]
MSTDPDWFRFLRERADLEEINFWRPGVRSLNMAKGTPWLFLIRETGQIWGCGYFSTFSYMPVGVAWDTFGPANGFDDYASFVRKIAEIKRVPERNAGDVGCAVLSQPQYFDEPINYGPVGRVYGPITSIDARTEEGAYLRSAVARVQKPIGVSVIPSGQGQPVLVIPRLGQATFRIELEKQYQMRCAVTGERTRPVLDAAHIKPYSLVKEHSLKNGLLLRKDIHKLFDDGYVTVSPERRFIVSKAIRDEFENGRDYYALHGQEIRETVSSEFRPAPEYLEWHASTRFKG